MTKKNVERSIPAGESDKVEFKLPGADITSLAAAACAFLNSEGGRLFIGVADDGSVVGVDDAVGLVGGHRPSLPADAAAPGRRLAGLHRSKVPPGAASVAVA